MDQIEVNLKTGAWQDGRTGAKLTVNPTELLIHVQLRIMRYVRQLDHSRNDQREWDAQNNMLIRLNELERQIRLETTEAKRNGHK